MNSIIRNIRLAASRFIAPTTVVTPDTVQDQLSETLRQRSVMLKQNPSMDQEYVATPLNGHISTQDLSDLSSTRGRSAIANLGAWSAIARAYNAYVKDPKSATVTTLLNEFHAWNACSGSSEMDEDAVLELVAKLTVQKPAKGSAATDEIIARVRKCSVADVQAKREAAAAVRTKAREEALEAFLAQVWAHVYSDHEFYMPAAKAEAKILQTMEWVAGWDSANPADQAAELLLLESDLKQLRTIAAHDHDNRDDFVEGVMASDTINKRYAA